MIYESDRDGEIDDASASLECNWEVEVWWKPMLTTWGKEGGATPITTLSST